MAAHVPQPEVILGGQTLETRYKTEINTGGCVGTE